MHSDEQWLQTLPMVAVSAGSACAVCQHAIINGNACAQRCCTENGCMPLRRDNIHVPKGFH